MCMQSAALTRESTHEFAGQNIADVCVKSTSMHANIRISMCMCGVRVYDWLMMNRHLLSEVSVACQGSEQGLAPMTMI